ncbi:MAG: 50S ribosomal protein L9 [Phycisphaerales bacterium]
MAKYVELLLVETVEPTGIVGDVVKVRPGFARNFLLPRGLATEPNEELKASLAQRRAEAERDLAERRARMESMIEKIDGYELTTERAANEQGLLYGSVTQQEIADMLTEAGFGVRPRDVRIGQTIKRADRYDIVIKPANDLEATVVLIVKAEGAAALEALEAAERAEREAASAAAQDAELAEEEDGKAGSGGAAGA